MRRPMLSTIPAIPIAIDSAIRPDAASASVAPTAASPLRTTAKDEANPTKAATRPAVIGCATVREGIGVSPAGRINLAIIRKR